MYWSCTKFADYIRGTKKPSAATSDGWNSWTIRSKNAHPFRHWLAETGLDAIQSCVNYIPDLLKSAKRYIVNAYVLRTHSLTSSTLEKGSWNDVGNRFVPCLFDELVNFVEVECAWDFVLFDPAEYSKIPWYYKGWFNFGKWRNAEKGIEQIYWLIDVDRVDKTGNSSNQSVELCEVLSLYMWYKNVYLKRVSADEESGWADYCTDKDLYSGFGNDPTATALIKQTEAIEASNTQEDTEMLIRLIRVRSRLWT